MKINKKRLELEMANCELTVSELAEKSQISVSAIGDIKRGRNARPATVGALAKALNVGVEELVEGDRHEPL